MSVSRSKRFTTCLCEYCRGFNGKGTELSSTYADLLFFHVGSAGEMWRVELWFFWLSLFCFFFFK